MECVFTILSEFSQYTEAEVLNFSVAKQRILFKEARRQRASKCALLASLINMPNLKEESDRHRIVQTLEQSLNPHFIVEHHHDQKKVNDSWNALRMRKHGL